MQNNPYNSLINLNIKSSTQSCFSFQNITIVLETISVLNKLKTLKVTCRLLLVLLLFIYFHKSTACDVTIVFESLTYELFV